MSVKIGLISILGVKEEKKLVEWIIKIGQIEFTITKKYLIDTIQKIVLQGKIDTPFIYRCPSRKWFEDVLKCNLIISFK